MTVKTKETYRHALAATTTRAGLDGTPYLYTLNLSCRQEQWDDLRPLFQQCVDDFALLQPTADYIAPDKVKGRYSTQIRNPDSDSVLYLLSGRGGRLRH